jgi:hypothetical protein
VVLNLLLLRDLPKVGEEMGDVAFAPAPIRNGMEECCAHIALTDPLDLTSLVPVFLLNLIEGGDLILQMVSESPALSVQVRNLGEERVPKISLLFAQVSTPSLEELSGLAGDTVLGINGPPLGSKVFYKG